MSLVLCVKLLDLIIIIKYNDDVLDLYYATARMYDEDTRRFLAVDPVKGYITNIPTMVQYLYVLDNPLKYIDLLGKFLRETCLTKNASGDDVRELNYYLFTYGYMTYNEFMASRHDYTNITTGAVKKYQEANGLYQSGNVSNSTWTDMELSVNNSFEEEFWKGKKGSDKLNIVIEGNDVTINYSPAVYISEDGVSEQWVYWQGSYHRKFMPCKQPVNDTTYDAYLDRVVNGLKYWESESVYIQGITGTVTVNVTPTRAEKKRDADIKLDISDTGRGVTLGSIGWSPGDATGFSIPLGKQSTFKAPNADGVDNVSNVVAHEFGHVVGLMDAYSELYNFNQEVPDTRVHEDGIMRTPYHKTPVISSTEYEMMLYAWSTGGMQGYYGLELMASESQAFFR